MRIAEEREMAAHRRRRHGNRTTADSAHYSADPCAPDLAEDHQAEVVDVDEVPVEAV